MTGRNPPDRVESGHLLRGRDIVCFSHDWSGDPLSKTHLMRILSRDNRVLWVNSIPNRTPTASKKDLSRIFFKLRSFGEPIKEVEPNIFVMSPLAIPSYSSSSVRRFNQRLLLSQVRSAMGKLRFESPINFVFNPAAGLLARKLGEKELIYYCVDEYTAFTGASKGLKKIEEDLFRDADVVVVSAMKLLESKRRLNPHTFLIRHGTDWHHFHNALNGRVSVPSEISDLPKPVIGFHGLLADWVDYELIRKIALRFAHGSVVLIGGMAVDAEEKIKVLAGLSNVYILGRKPYSDLPGYCKGFDVAINPFVVNDLTLAANPLKVREYLAAGLVTVSTDLPEVRVLRFCRVAASHGDFLEELKTALEDDVPRQLVSDSVKRESWEARVEELRELLGRTKDRSV